jgi:hypothetical protein
MTTPCREYDGFLNAKGYGRVNKRIDGRLVSKYAHRLAWEQAYGPIPEGMMVMHLCDNTSCVEVSHLRLGTHADNMADMKAKQRARWQENAPGTWTPQPGPGRLSERDHCKHGHEYTPENTCIQPKTGWRSCRECRRESDRRRRSGLVLRSDS